MNENKRDLAEQPYTAIYSPFEEMMLSEALEHVFLLFQLMCLTEQL